VLSLGLKLAGEGCKDWKTTEELQMLYVSGAGEFI
jgi:hypothetical protein